MNNDNDFDFAGDREFVSHLAERLPSVAVPSELSARLLADFDRLSVKRQRTVFATLASLSDRIWPGAPLWQPASLLALSLMVGLMAGAFVPSAKTATNASYEASLIASDTPLAMDLYRDI